MYDIVLCYARYYIEKLYFNDEWIKYVVKRSCQIKNGQIQMDLPVPTVNGTVLISEVFSIAHGEFG